MPLRVPHIHPPPPNIPAPCAMLRGMDNEQPRKSPEPPPEVGPEAPGSRWLTMPAIAALLGISERAARDWVRRHDLPVHGSRPVRVSEQVVLARMAAEERVARKPPEVPSRSRPPIAWPVSPPPGWRSCRSPRWRRSCAGSPSNSTIWPAAMRALLSRSGRCGSVKRDKKPNFLRSTRRSPRSKRRSPSCAAAPRSPRRNFPDVGESRKWRRPRRLPPTARGRS